MYRDNIGKAWFLYLPIKTIHMADDKTNVGMQDRIRVNASDPSEVEYVHRQFPHLPHQQVLDAVREKGPLREDIIKYLQSLG